VGREPVEVIAFKSTRRRHSPSIPDIKQTPDSRLALFRIRVPYHTAAARENAQQLDRGRQLSKHEDSNSHDEHGLDLIEKLERHRIEAADERNGSVVQDDGADARDADVEDFVCAEAMRPDIVRPRCRCLASHSLGHSGVGSNSHSVKCRCVTSRRQSPQMAVHTRRVRCIRLQHHRGQPRKNTRPCRFDEQTRGERHRGLRRRDSQQRLCTGCALLRLDTPLHDLVLGRRHDGSKANRSAPQ